VRQDFAAAVLASIEIQTTPSTTNYHQLIYVHGSIIPELVILIVILCLLALPPRPAVSIPGHLPPRARDPTLPPGKEWDGVKEKASIHIDEHEQPGGSVRDQGNYEEAEEMYLYPKVM
jgi:hypothetical protein